MQDLRLVGISENGEQVLLTDGAGGRYSLALNDDLKRVVRRDKTQTVGMTAQTSPQAPLRPRDVQTLIRAGVPLEEIAERAGWSVEKVLRYEGPIRAERDYIGELAQSVILDSREDSVTLRDRAAKRLADRGVEAERVVWDSWKSDEDHWSVVVRFPAGGRLREATWHFDPRSRALRAVDDEARWLGGDENARAPKSVTEEAPARPSSAPVRDEPVFDVEAEGWEDETGSQSSTGHENTEHREELTAAMRQRHANRRAKSTAGANDPASITGVAPAPTKPTMTAQDSVESLDLSGEAPPFGSHPRPSEFLSVADDSDSVTPLDAPTTSDSPEPETFVPETSHEDAATPAAEETSKSTSSESGRDRRRTQRRSRAQVDHAPSNAETDHDPQHDEGDVEAGAKSRPDEKSRSSAHASASLREEDDVQNDQPQEAVVSEESVDAPQVPETTGEAHVPTRPAQTRKGGRPSVPSWDDIMFGGRSKR